MNRVYALMHAEPIGAAARWLQGAIQALILLNVAAVVAETVPQIEAQHGSLLQWFEHVSIIVFLAEYILRVLSCTGDERFTGSIVGRFRYMVTPMALVDLLAIAPMFAPWLVSVDMRGIRALRLMRIFRILKLGRYSKAVRSLGKALTSKKEELAVMLFAMSILLVLAASILYIAEHEAQPQSFSSIPATAWWAVTTLTTVGYGDMAPVTNLGKVAAAIVAVLGLALFALPAGVLASSFVEQVSAEKQRCPHCGENL